MTRPRSAFEYEGHYVVDGECCACGRKVDDLEKFVTRIPPVEVFWTADEIRKMPKQIQDMIRRMDR